MATYELSDGEREFLVLGLMMIRDDSFNATKPMHAEDAETRAQVIERAMALIEKFGGEV
jgi:hypothetical protein